MGLKVAIVGAGLSGLTALKHCLAEGIIGATIFEERDTIGGQWNYEEPDPETGHANSSIYKNVILNSCRDTSSFGDFPIDPGRYPDYFGHEQFLRYLHEYMDHFGLKTYIQFNTKVISCRQPQGGRKWQVVYQKQQKESQNQNQNQQGNDGDEPRTILEIFDAVIACSGYLSQPLVPEFKDMNRFKGEIFHSHIYRNPANFEGKKVAVIGFGNSAADISCEISTVAKEVHLVTRRGGWVIPRYVLGKPAEAYDSRFFETILPHKFSQWCQMRLCNAVMGEAPEEVKPDHRLMEANITMRTDLLENIRVGRITPHRAGIERFTEDSLVLSNETTLDVDVIICCTGYRIEMPYLLDEYYRLRKEDTLLRSSNALHLYKLVAATRFPNLFCIGFVHLEGPLVPVSEAQARWAASVINKQIKLPSVETMEEYIRAYQEDLATHMVQSDRHASIIRYLPYCDSLVSELRATPTLWRLARKIFSRNPIIALKVLIAVYFGINSPAQYRLFGHGSTPDLGRETMLRMSRGDNRMNAEEKRLANRYNIGLTSHVFGWRW